MNFADFVTGTASVAVLTDVLVLLLPTWIVYDLQIPKKQKIMLIGILSFQILCNMILRKKLIVIFVGVEQL